jgi:integrase
MARSIRSHQLETRSQRLRLPIRGKPYNARIGKGLRLCYRRCRLDGTWSRLYRGELKRIAIADDFTDANGGSVLSWDQAVSRCRLDVYGADESAIEGADRPVTLDQAITAYEADLVARDGGRKNATWLRARTPAGLLKKAVSAITAKDFRGWRDSLIAEGKLTAGTVNRLRAALLAALNNQKRLDPRVRDVWSIGWPLLPNARRSRNVVLTAAEIRAVVRASYAISEALGLFVEMAAVTGARPSQLARLDCADVLAGDKVNMPTSRKGSSRKRVIGHKPVPLPPALAARLRAIAEDQPPDAALLVQDRGKGRWTAGSHHLRFLAAAKAAGLDAGVTIYALRHSYITNALLRGVPLRLVADVVDSSVTMIERSYSAHISHHGDAMLRAGLVDFSEPPPGGNVVPLARGDRPA